MKLRRTLALALMMLVTIGSVTGGTIAWFTDSVTSANNVIQAGTLDVDVYRGNAADKDSIQDEDKLFTSVARWEPGAAAWENLTVVNLGDLALKYEMVMNTTDFNKVGVNDLTSADLTSALKVGIVDGGVAAGETRETVLSKVNAWTSFDGFKAAGELKPTDEPKTYGVVVYWQPTADDNKWNVNNDKTVDNTGVKDGNKDKDYLFIDLGVKLVATQAAVEQDSFGKDYDANPKENVRVSTPEELGTALANAENGDVIVVGADINLTETFAFNRDDIEVTLDLGGKTITGTPDTLFNITDGTLNFENGTIKNVKDNAKDTKVSIRLAGDAQAKIKGVKIETSGTGILMKDDAKITELNADIESFMNANGYCAFDAVTLDGNARIEKITGGNYTSYITEGYINAWLADPNHSYSAINSHSISLLADGASIGEISGGTFLGVMDSAGSSGCAAIQVNAGRIEMISGGHFGFYEKSLRNAPDRLIFVNTNNGGSIDKITGGTFVKGAWKPGFSFDFAGVVEASGSQIVDTGKTVEVKTQFTTRIQTDTLQVVEVAAK